MVPGTYKRLIRLAIDDREGLSQDLEIGLISDQHIRPSLADKGPGRQQAGGQRQGRPDEGRHDKAPPLGLAHRPVIAKTAVWPRRLVLTGPESTGKSTLAVHLAGHFQVPLVPEFARAYIQDKLLRCGRNCALEDVPRIAWGQQAAEKRALAQTEGRFVVCDTDVLTIRVWSECFFGAVPAELEPLLEQLRPRLAHDLYLLTDIDVPWVADGVRDRPADREAQMALFRRRLHEMGCHLVLISGDWERRRRQAIAAVEGWCAGPGGKGPNLAGSA